MSEGIWARAAAFGIMAVTDAAVVGATGYVVFGLGASGWWFLAALVFCAGNNPTRILSPRPPETKEVRHG